MTQPLIRTSGSRRGMVSVLAARPVRRIRARWRRVRLLAQAGMSTAEYAVGTLAAVTFATVLIAVVRSDTVKSALSGIIQSALNIAG